MKPTIGRIVHYNLGTGDGEIAAQAALVIAVHDGDVVSLSVCNAGGTWRTETRIAEGTDAGTWRWPPR